MADAVFITVVSLRLLVPLGIPRYPLPFIVASLVLDGIDQTILDAADATALLDDYQAYDKALDVYYLAIAYVSALRNWTDPFALGVARFLFYYRLVGTLAFALDGSRDLLVVFPNTFEYYFILYEAIRLRWDPGRLSHRFLLGSAAALWVGIKLPQEYWVHGAQLDVTDEMAAHPWLLPAFLVGCALLGLAAWSQRRRLPPRDRAPTFDVDVHIDRTRPAVVPLRRDLDAVLSIAVLEKVLLLGMVVAIFSQVIEARATTAQMSIAVAAVVVLNAAISIWRWPSPTPYGSAVRQFGAMMLVNGGLLVGGIVLRRTAGVSAYLQVQDAVFYLLLVSLVITLYDRYRVIAERARPRSARGPGRPGDPRPAAAP